LGGAWGLRDGGVRTSGVVEGPTIKREYTKAIRDGKKSYRKRSQKKQEWRSCGGRRTGIFKKGGKSEKREIGGEPFEKMGRKGWPIARCRKTGEREHSIGC